MKVILCYMPEFLINYEFTGSDTPPLSIYLLAGILEQEGYQVRVFDPYAFYQYQKSEEVLDKSADLIASSVEAGDILCFSSNTFNWPFTKKMINMVGERCPENKIITGGLHPSIFDEYVLRTTKALAVLRGEGEVTICKVVHALEHKLSLEDIPGITYRKGDDIVRNEDCKVLSGEYLEQCALPDYSLVPKEANYLAIPVESSRGCAFSCAFCSIPYRHKWRGYSVDQVLRRVDHAKSYADRFVNNADILFTDDCFTIDNERAKAVMKELEQRGYDNKYFIEVRASNVLNGDLFESIDSALIRSMQIGVECGYDEGLKRIKKGLTIKELMEALEKLKALGLAHKILLSFIIGFPWETEEDMNKTLETIEYIAKMLDIHCNINWLIFLPSDLWKEREKYGIQVDESCYDDLFWTSDRELFDKVHPLLTEPIMMRIERKIERMKLKGYPVTFNKLTFRTGLNYVSRKKYM